MGPNAVKAALQDHRIELEQQQIKHNEVWTALFRSDDWFDHVNSPEYIYRPNPIISGRDMKTDAYLVFADMDWEGDATRNAPNLRDSLKDHDYDTDTHECTIKDSGQILNISYRYNGDFSYVPNLEERLVKQDADGTRSVQLLHLRDYRPRTLKNLNQPCRRIDFRCSASFYEGNVLSWCCLEKNVT